MSKVKLTKGELKKQRDALRQYERYLPTLQLKKQQLQIEITRQHTTLLAKKSLQAQKKKAIEAWTGLLLEMQVQIRQWLSLRKTITTTRNIAGLNVLGFERVEFMPVEYDLFSTPLWVDNGFEALKELVALQEEIRTIEDTTGLLKQELRITTQRVNLFEKVKIPETEEAIRLIKIYIGDQMANAVGRCKIAKRKIEYANA